MSTELMASAAESDIIALPAEIKAKLAADLPAVPMGTVKLTPEQQKSLLVRATEAQVQLKPTGEIYMPGVFYRSVLQVVFGPGAWHVDPGTPQLNVQDEAFKSTLYLKVRLIVGRCTRCQRSALACECGQPVEDICIAEDIGAAQYHPTNARLSLDDAIVSATTNGLMRCCSKTLGVFANCWEPQWADDARWAVGVKVSVRDWNNKVKIQWRRWDRRPFDAETGLAADSPNKDKYAPTPTVQKAPVAPVPAVKAAAPVVKGEQIGGIRKAPNGGWSVTTDAGTHWTDDEQMARSLEATKNRGKRVVIENEILPGGQKRILDFKTI